MIYFSKWKIITIFTVCVLGILYAMPNLFPRQLMETMPSWAPRAQINLGLDLQGGSHLLLEVDVNSVLRERVTSLMDSARVTLRRENIGYIKLAQQSSGISFALRDAADFSKVREAIRRADGDVEIRSDGPNVTVRITDQAMRDRRQAVIDQSLEIVRRRIDETGIREPTIQRQGEDRIVVQLPGEKDPERIKRLLGRTAKMNFRLVDSTPVEEARAGRAPPGSELLPSDHERDASGQPIQYLVQRRVMVGGDTLVDAQASFQDGQPVVSFRFDTIGARKFGQVTKENVGKPFAIVLDGKVISAPVIRDAILGGSGIISGRFSVQEVRDLALLLRAGALPAPLKVLEERTVGPGLGEDSIRAGTLASLLAMGLVVVFMVLVYGLFGLFANVALIFNMVILTAAMSVLQATLTLPGIAGIALTIGMAVDANVLIFERMREEQANGRTPLSSVDAGFSRAFTTILDANLTTLFAALLLYHFGTGPIRGFAVTLAIGLATSMFTAISVTRLIVVVWLRWRRPKALPL